MTVFKFDPLLAALFTVSTSFATLALGNEEEGTENPETRLAISLAAQVYPDALGGESIAVFFDREKTGEGKNSLNSKNLNRVRFYVLPYFYPTNFTSFQDAVQQQCADNNDTSIQHPAGYRIAPKKRVEVPIDFEVASRIVNDQIVEALNHDFGISAESDKITRGQLNPYPFSSLHIVAGMRRHAADRPMQELYRFPVIPEALAADTVQARAVSFPTQLSTESVIVTGECQALVDAAYYKDLWAYVLTPFDRVSRNSAEISYGAFFGSEAFLDILSDETQTGGTTTTRSSDGNSFILNFEFGGATGDSSEDEVRTIDDRSRAVTSDVLSEATLKFAESAHSRIVIEDPKNADLYNIKEIADRALKLVEGISRTVTVELGKLDDGRTSYIEEGTARYLGVGNENVLLKGESAPDQEASSETEFTTNDGVKTKVTKDNKYKDNRGVTWDYDGTAWVPTSIDMRVVSRNMASGGGVFGMSSSTAVRANREQLIMLPRILSAGPQDTGPKIPRLEPRKIVIHFDFGPIQTSLLERRTYRNELTTDSNDVTSRWVEVSSLHCSDQPSPPSGYIRVGGEIEKVALHQRLLPDNGAGTRSDGGQQYHCLPLSLCRERLSRHPSETRSPAGPVTISTTCVSSSYSSGCFVNIDWFEWYETQHSGQFKYSQKDENDEWKKEMCNEIRISDRISRGE